MPCFCMHGGGNGSYNTTWPKIWVTYLWKGLLGSASTPPRSDIPKLPSAYGEAAPFNSLIVLDTCRAIFTGASPVPAHPTWVSQDQPGS